MERTATRFGLTALVLFGCLAAAPTAAKADISWTFNNVNFSIGSWSPGGEVYTEVASLSGSFSTNNAATAVTSFSDLKVTAAQPSDSNYAFAVAGVVNSYLPNEIGIYGTGFAHYIDLYLTSPLSGGAKSYSFSAGFDCPGCAILSPGSDPVVVGTGGAQIVTGDVVVTPEPGLYALLVLGLSGLAFAGWRRRNA